MGKAEIIAEIQRIAASNGGVAPGWRKLAAATGIKYADWCGVHWARWNDALREAGLAPNQLTEAYKDSDLLEIYATFTAALGRLPTGSDLRLQTKRDPDFPNDRTFDRLGSKAEIAAELITHCHNRPEFDVVSALASQYVSKHASNREVPASTVDEEELEGFVYMERFGKHYKVGHTTAVPRRHREISMELPEKPSIVHVIRTDDPKGIERYWQERFKKLHTNGEWFALTQREVRAFKRRRFM